MSDRYEQDRERHGRDRGSENERGRESWRGGQSNQEFEGAGGYQNSGNDDREWRSGNRNDAQQNQGRQSYQDDQRMSGQGMSGQGMSGQGRFGRGENNQQGYRGGSHRFQNDFNRGGEFDRENYNSMGGPSQSGRWEDQNDWSSSRGSWSGTQAQGQGTDAGRYAAGGSYYGGSSNFGGGMNQYGDQGRHSGRGPKGYKRSDDRIKDDVNERLTHDSWVDASEIEVQVKDGEVTLTGTVTSRDEKRRAEDAIEQVSGVREVHNQLRVQTQNQGSAQNSGASSGSGTSGSQSGNQQTSKANSGQQTASRS